MRSFRTSAGASLLPPANTWLLVLALALPAAAQRYPHVFERGTPDGDRLELVDHQLGASAKREYVLKFLADYPKHPASDWLLEFLQRDAMENRTYRQVIEYGEKLLALHPEDFDAMWRCWKAAEALGDKTAASLWNDRLLQLSQRMLTAKKPAALDAAIWEQNLQSAKALVDEREYEQFRQVLAEPAPRKRAQALEEFVRRYPGSPYNKQIPAQLMHAWHAAGDASHALAAAEKVLAKEPENLDANLIVAQVLMERRTNYPRVIAMASRVVQLAGSMVKPEDWSDAEWQKRKAYYLGSANLFLGNAYVNTNAFPAADRALRAALPYVKGTGQTEAAVLFYLGWSNYHLERYNEAAAYFKQCLTFGGEYAAQASRNLVAMRNERRIKD